MPPRPPNLVPVLEEFCIQSNSVLERANFKYPVLDIYEVLMSRFISLLFDLYFQSSSASDTN